MPLAIVAIIVVIMKFADIDPVARWSWWLVLLPFGLLFLWWEFISPLVGWDRRAAAKKMAAEEKEAAERKKKERGF